MEREGRRAGVRVVHLGELADQAFSDLGAAVAGRDARKRVDVQTPVQGAGPHPGAPWVETRGQPKLTRFEANPALQQSPQPYLAAVAAPARRERAVGEEQVDARAPAVSMVKVDRSLAVSMGPRKRWRSVASSATPEGAQCRAENDTVALDPPKG
jgi:hypothetical protein